ncbi:NAD(P)H-dependent oxidoreductase [uncultured Clostridium sp.]|jgi:FMN-dependent NADH-azoreductase|uniref:NAD(P)H-dependent oxidoreductase n=1 Tax=uncultured Clostridium sp. TaxID=59620 RepID=UPI0026229CCE|nr:NAD(P)H-dependent oxidoreductase [uncultured Clostridium sp.]
MKKILYISVNSKSESDSASKTVARKLIDEVLCQCRYKVPKCNENIYVFDGYDDDLGQASNYKKSSECCENEKEVCCETNHELVCFDEGIEVHDEKNEEEHGKVCDLKENKYEIDKLDVEEDDKDETVEEYNVETTEIKEKHKSKVCCDDINEFIKDCSQDVYNGMNEEDCDKTKHHHHNDNHESECCESNNGHHHHHECCDEKHDHMHGYCAYDEEHHCHDTEDWEECNDFIVEEIDLYKDYIPLLTHEFYSCRNTLVDGPGPCYEELTHVQRKDMARIKELAIQFKEADIYIIAAPMWSLLFPAPLKQYLDCVILNGVTTKINDKVCKGLLDDKERKMVFVQSVGGELPILLKYKLDHSAAYLKDISKFLGISKFTELLVDGTGYTANEKEDAICEAIKDVAHIAKSLIK